LNILTRLLSFRSLQAKFLAITIPLVLASTGALFAFSQINADRAEMDRLSSKIEELVAMQSASLAGPLWNLDEKQILLILDAMIIDPEIIGVVVYDENGGVYVKVGKLTTEGVTVLNRSEVIEYESEVYGRLEVAFTDSLSQKAAKERLQIAGGMALLLVISVVLSVLLAHRRTVGVPLLRLSDSIRAAKEHGIREPVMWQSEDEMGAVVSAYNEMQHQQEVYEKELVAARDNLEERVEERTHELSAARQRLTDSIESISEGFSLYDSEDSLILCNNQYRSLLYPGMEESIVPGVTFDSVIRRAAESGLIEDAKDQPEIWVQNRLTRHRNPGEPMTYRTAGGQWIQVSERRTEDGGTVAIYTDLTEIKGSEEELRKSKERFHDLFENAPIAMFEEDWTGIEQSVKDLKKEGVTDLEAYFKEHPEFVANFANLVEWHDFNNAAVQLYGAKDRASLREHLTDTEGSYSWEAYANVVLAFDRGERHLEQEVVEETVDGGKITIVFACQLGENASNWSSVTTTSLDITEQRRFQLALQESEERYMLSMRGSNEGLWDWDRRTDKIFISPHLKKLLGLEISDHDYTTPEAWEARIHPEDLDQHLEAQRAHFAGETEFNISEYRVRDKDGTYRWVLDRGAALKYSNGEIYRMAGSVSDISERKLAEQELASKSNALEQLSNQLAKYLSPQVYDSIFSGKQEVKLASQRKRLTIFFSDIVGFTTTTEKLESEDLTQLLNNYLTEMSQIALEYGATIDKYIGDAIVIFFGDPESLGVKEDALACVKMAIAMRNRMLELESIWLNSGVENPLKCRMGINTGMCTVGNFGSDDRMDYTIIGGGVNLAARLESACPQEQILISYETYAHVKDEIYCEEYENIHVKGITHPVSTYKVIDLHENLSVFEKSIKTSTENFQLEINAKSMSKKEQKQVIVALTDAVEQLTKSSR
jgi:PAS domain S-box-containing protein